MLRFPFIALIRRELLRSLRDGRLFVCLIPLVLGAMLVVLFSFPAAGTPITQWAAAAQLIMIQFTLILLGGVGLFMPAVSAASIVLERDQNTFEQLQLTLVSPAGVIVGKFVNAIGLCVILLIATLPIIGAVYFLIGVNVFALLQCFAVMLAAMCSLAMIGIYCSARFRSTLVAILVAYFLGFIFMGGYFLLLAAAEELGIIHIQGSVITPYLIRLIPLGTVVAIIQGMVTSRDMVYVFLFHGFIATVFFGLSLRWVHRWPSHTPRIESPARTRSRRGPSYAPSAPGVISLIGRQRPWRAIGDRANPIYRREALRGPLTKPRALVFVFFALLFLLGIPCAYYHAEVQPFVYRRTHLLSEYILPSFLTVTIASMVLAPLFLANLITREYETGTFDSLRMTLLGASRYLLGKTAAGMRLIAPLVLASAVVLTPLFLYIATRGQPVVAVMTFGTYTMCLALAIVCSLVAAAFTRRTLVALVVCYILQVIAHLGVFGILGSTLELARLLWRVPQSTVVRIRQTFDIIWERTSPIAAYVENAIDREGDIPTLTQVLGSSWFDCMIICSIAACALFMLAIRRLAKLDCFGRY